MTDPIRSALKRLLSAVLDGLGQDDHPMVWARVDDAIDAARAALAQSELKVLGPSDEELIKEAIAVGLAFQPQDEAPEVFLPFDAEEPLDKVLVDFARAVLARYGHQPAPPAAGEDKAPAVTEVIAWLRTEAEIDDGFELTQSAAYQRRAAELLERQVAPVAAGEVTELVAWLRTISKLFRLDQLGDEADRTDRAADLLEQRHPTPVPDPLDSKDLQRIQRMCAIVLGHEFGNSELDSLALELGHHPAILGALPLPAGEVE